MPRLQLHVALHHGLAIGTSEGEMAGAVHTCQRPLIEALERHPAVPCALHMTGHALEWLDLHDGGLADRLFALCSAGTVEMIGGGFYAPILSLLPWRDAIGQLEMMAGYLERHTGRRPVGAWLERRVWEPRLAEVLADGGVRYTFLEEHQLVAAGARLPLRRPLVTEHIGRPLALLPIDAELSRLALAGDNDGLAGLLRGRAREAAPGSCVTLSLSLSHRFSRAGGGVEGLLETIEALAGLVDVRLPSEALGRRDPPPERIYVPSSAGSLVGPGLWQRWLARHGTADRMHKRMVDVSRRFAALERVVRNQGWRAMSQLSRPRRWLYRAQNAQAYAAGEGGGLLHPEVRAAAWRNLIDAERAADEIVRGEVDFLELSLRDLYADLGTAVLLRNRRLRAVLRPEKGGVLAELEHAPSGTALTDVLAPGAPTSDDQPARPAGGEGGPDPACLHTRFIAADAPAGAWLRGGGELGDLIQARFRLMSVDSEGRGADERAHVVLSGEGTLALAGRRIAVSLLQHVRLAARDEALTIRLELRLEPPLPEAVHFVTTWHLNLQPRLHDGGGGGAEHGAADASGVEIEGRPAPGLDARARDLGVRRVVLFNRALDLRVSLQSDLPVIAERAPVLSPASHGHPALFQGTALGLRLPLAAGASAIDWGLRVALTGDPPGPGAGESSPRRHRTPAGGRGGA